MSREEAISDESAGNVSLLFALRNDTSISLVGVISNEHGSFTDVNQTLERLPLCPHWKSWSHSNMQYLLGSSARAQFLCDFTDHWNWESSEGMSIQNKNGWRKTFLIYRLSQEAVKGMSSLGFWWNSRLCNYIDSELHLQFLYKNCSASSCSLLCSDAAQCQTGARAHLRGKW